MAVTEGVCVVEPLDPDERYGLDGVLLFLQDIPDTDFYEIDVRGLIRLEDGALDAEHGNRAVHRLGNLLTSD
ncbi:hypothetical protein FM104_14400 [Microbacterium esteraromaticum]|uniref:Uncharacterized protein n=1 Tax=Microbacterium esteraromaticum TaxID=57043 RepID=A0A1R4KPD0_9MICO|nr:hypothetical protein FM104_14400 [Microbacterium esteraromaticum]